MNKTEESKKKNSGLKYMLIAHVACCGIPMAFILFGAAGFDLLLQFINDAIIPGGGILVTTIIVLFIYRTWKKQKSKNTCSSPHS